jgi:hypothetical protein
MARASLWIALFLALLPQSFGWNPSRTDCCQDACECTSAEEPSCCEEDEGPVLVAACGCGHSHGPRTVHRSPFDWFAPPASPALATPVAPPVMTEASEGLVGRTPVPEPPPPRPVDG